MSNERRFEISFEALIIGLAIIGATIIYGIKVYQDGRTQQLETELKIEQEKNKTDATTGKYKDY